MPTLEAGSPQGAGPPQAASAASAAAGSRRQRDPGPGPRGGHRCAHRSGSGARAASGLALLGRRTGTAISQDPPRPDSFPAQVPPPPRREPGSDPGARGKFGSDAERTTEFQGPWAGRREAGLTSAQRAASCRSSSAGARGRQAGIGAADSTPDVSGPGSENSAPGGRADRGAQVGRRGLREPRPSPAGKRCARPPPPGAPLWSQRGAWLKLRPQCPAPVLPRGSPARLLAAPKLSLPLLAPSWGKSDRISLSPPFPFVSSLPSLLGTAGLSPEVVHHFPTLTLYSSNARIPTGRGPFPWLPVWI